MAKGANQTQRINIIDSYDPRSTGRAAQKGTLFLFIPASGDCELLVKQDDGYSTNWEAVGGGSSPTPSTFVTVASTGNVNIAVAPATVDGIAYDTVLLKNQFIQADRGVYQFNGTGQPLTRLAGWDTAADFVPGKLVYVDQGNTQANTLWANANAVVTLGVTAINFIEISAVDFMDRSFSNSLPAAIDIDLGTHKIVNVVDPTDPQDAATKNYVDTQAMQVDFSNAAPSIIDLNLGNHLINNVLDPVSAQDAATKNYVDNADALAANKTLSNLTNPTAINQDLVSGVVATWVVRTANQIGATASQGVVFRSGDLVNGTSGQANLRSGNASGTGASGGVTVNSGTVAATSALPSGNMSFISGTNAGSGASGNLLVGSGNQTGTGASGSVLVSSGNSTTASGNITAQTGIVSAGATASGSVVLRTGAQNGTGISGSPIIASGNSAAGSSGSVFISTGNLASGGGISGNIDFTTGTSTGTRGGVRVFSRAFELHSDGAAPQPMFFFDADNSNWVGFVAPNVVGANVVWQLPAADGSANQVLKTSGANVLSFGDAMSGPQIATIRVVTGTDTVLANADYKILCNASAGAFDLNLPAGVDGQTFVLSQASVNAGTFTIQPNGGDVIDANVQSIFNTNQPVPITFVAGVWYAI